MKTFTKAAAQLVATTLLSLSLPLVAQAGGDHTKKMGMDHGKIGMAASPGMTDGEIRKIDKESGKITIKHGEIKHMDMPPMSMVFNVKEKAMLDNIQVGEKIQFIVIQDAGKMVVTDIQPGK